MAAGYAAVRALRRRRRAARDDARSVETDTLPYAPAIVAGVWLVEFALG
jgi:hypothetical protein